MTDPAASLAALTRAASHSERRLVVISYHFPPDGSVGGLRWSGLTKYLSAAGWKSWVVTAAPSDASHLANGVVVVSCPRQPTLNDAYRWFRRRLGPAGSGERSLPGRQDHSRAGSGLGWIGALRLEGGMLLGLPDEGRGWILRAAAHARRLIRHVRPDAVVSSGPPHSAHVAAWLATRGIRTRWLVDLRDPWSALGHSCHSHAARRSHLWRWVAGRLERLVSTSAAGVLCTTPELASAIEARYAGVRAQWIPNGVDGELIPKSAAHYPGLGIAYAGTMYGAHDLGPVLQALRVFLDRYPRAREAGAKLRIAGTLESRHLDILRRQAAALGLSDCVEVVGVLPRSAALELVARSRLAVVLAQQLDANVPAKLYETVAMGVLTLMLAAPHSAASAEAQRLGAVAVEPNDIQSIVGVMEDLWLERKSNRRVQTPDALVDYRERARQLSPILSGD